MGSGTIREGLEGQEFLAWAVKYIELNADMEKTEMEKTFTDRIPVVFGEVLFDIFPEGARVLGGAPFNVAWHLQGFGARPLMISSVGNDELGKDILRRMENWGMDTAGIQKDEEHGSGAVKVLMKNGNPSYEILRDRAWDFIEAGPALEAVRKCRAGMLYHGSLAARSGTSRRTLEILRKEADAPIFIDINLRPPDWSRALIEELLQGSRWIKLNRDELGELGRTLRAKETDALALAKEFGAQWVITTFGGEGAAFASPEFGFLQESAPPIEDMVDTVGAGDAFSAVSIYGFLSGWEPGTIIRRAAGFAADICRIQGATAERPELYNKWLNSWKQGEAGR